MPFAAQSKLLINELEDALAHGTVARRVETLQRVTDLFLNASTDYSDAQIALFDDVFDCLIRKIETSAKALLSNRIAPVPHAPPRLVHTLAFDDLIEIAAPVLSQSSQLDDKALIENARSKSQDHLLAISRRKVLSGAVTDVLLEHGNDEVVESTVLNSGAEFSDTGFVRLVERAEGDDNLTTCVATRPLIPRQHYLKLIARASATVLDRLQAPADPHASSEIHAAVKEATRRIHRQSAETEPQVVLAQGLVKSLHDEGRLNEGQVAAFAHQGQFIETAASIAVLANVDVATVEAMIMESHSEGVLVLAKVAGLSWQSLEAVLEMRATLGDNLSGDIVEYRTSYETLRPSTAQQVLRFHRMRQTAAARTSMH